MGASGRTGSALNAICSRRSAYQTSPLVRNISPAEFIISTARHDTRKDTSQGTVPSRLEVTHRAHSENAGFDTRGNSRKRVRGQSHQDAPTVHVSVPRAGGVPDSVSSPVNTPEAWPW